jgi:hypothetical protein
MDEVLERKLEGIGVDIPGRVGAQSFRMTKRYASRTDCRRQSRESLHPAVYRIIVVFPILSSTGGTGHRRNAQTRTGEQRETLPHNSTS